MNLTLGPLFLQGLILLSQQIPSILATSVPHCRCLPGSPCWPSSNEWAHLNKTVSGQLIAVRPVSSPCYPTTPDSSAQTCEKVTSSFSQSSWRVSQPGAYIGTSWEVSTAKNESCYLPTLLPPGSPPGECKQGNVPVYAVAARNADDIAATVLFAGKHNVPLAIKNSGHDFLGRSSRRGSLMVWTYWMKDIKFFNERGGWTPHRCSGKKYAEGELLVKVGAGVGLYDLYKAVGARNRTVVAGYANTVGVAGGYFQGGGHSPLGPWKGMSSDHVVEIDVVTADGSKITASPCANSDLFWALRGGGGSTFGVVTTVTLRTWPNPPMAMHLYNVTVPFQVPGADQIFWNLTERYLTLLPDISAAGGSGYHWFITNITDIGHQFISIHFFVNNSRLDAIASLFRPLETWVNTTLPVPDMLTQRELVVLPTTSMLFDITLTGSDNAGGTSLLGSRLLSRGLHSTRNGVSRIVDAFKRIGAVGGKFNVIIGHLVAGPGVWQNKHVKSGLLPAWREALTHYVVSGGWQPGDSAEKQKQAKRFMTEVLVPELKRLEPNMGAYVNEADKEEVDWQQTFWGSKYGRLKEIKQKWDPKGVFWCRPCVGSENWDKEGICRVSRQH